MKTSFVVSAVLWTAAFAVTNYTSIVPTVSGWIGSTPKPAAIRLLGQIQDGRMVIEGPEDQPRRVVTAQEYQNLTSVPPAQSTRIPLAVYVLGLVGIYGITGFNTINEWNRRPFTRLGRYVGAYGPGLVWIDPVLHHSLGDYGIWDYARDLEIGNLQSHDNVPLSMTIVITYRYMKDKLQDAVVNVESPWKAVNKRALSAVAAAVANAELDQILHSREKLQTEITQSVRDMVGTWGLHISAVEIKDVKITDEGIQEAIAMKARASKEADAELVRAKMQGRIAAELNTAAAVYNADGRWLKQLETMLELCRSAENNTVLLPTELLSILGKGSREKA